jgi:hypothetical protein
MEATKQPNAANTLLAIGAGIAATLLMALLLWPAVWLIFERYFEINFEDEPGSFTKTDFILYITIFLWLLIAAFAGAFVCTLINRSNEYLYAWVLSGITLIFTLYAGFSDSHFSSTDILLISILLIAACIGFLTGTKIGKSVKQKRKAINTRTSPPGIPLQ